jgi:hypothetical protein
MELMTMTNLSSTQARTIAESLWGRGGTYQEKTNRNGVFYFHCSGHGGYVASWNAFTSEEQEALRPHVTIEQATVATYRGKTVMHHANKTRATRYDALSAIYVDYVLFEEDCMWALVPLFTGVNLVLKPASKVDAKAMFDGWINPESPCVKARHEESEWRATGNPDLIISALSVTGQPGVVRVVTADQNHHIVTGYGASRDAFERPLLSLCERSTPVASQSIYALPSENELATLVA